MSERLGVLGGTFDPVHIAHLVLAETAREDLGLDRVLLVPTGHSWRKPGRSITPGDQRLEMLRLAVAGNERLEVSDVEVRRPGPSYTHETLEGLHAAHPEAALFFILGEDALADLPNWRDPARIRELATLAVAERPGSEGRLPGDVLRLEMPEIAISASAIRARVHAGRSIRYLVPESVREYIEAHGLYR